MASSSLSGEFRFLSEPDEDLKCVICFEVAKDPLQHEECGKLFCKECLEKYGRYQPCPNCRTGQSNYYSDNRSKYTKAKVSLAIVTSNAFVLQVGEILKPLQ